MQPMLARQGATGRMGVHNGNGKRTASALQSSSNSEGLGSSIKLGQTARDKERKEKEDVELKPPWDLLPYSRDTVAGYPDFYPSKGNEEEYKLTEKAITDGFENKSIVANESSGAAQDIVGQSMVEKSTLQNFSQFILSVLQHRHKDGLIKTPTTFRVPPRVTLTDQKREQYLRDLANPSQSLRRLARGVPHGIRGRTLLEQVCSKNVPVNRAIWFIRVISVNELRAVKRKGLTRGAQESVESKWVIEWTGQVAAFLETVIEECGKEKKVEDQQRWRARMTLRLVTYLYSEQLIDQATFLKWCLGFTEKSAIEVSPIIVILIGIFWDDLIARRATGRKLTELLLDKVDIIFKSSKSPILAPVVASISEKLQIILLRYPDYLIHPKRWSQLSPTLQKCLLTSTPEIRAINEQIQLRNANLSDPEMRPFLPDLEPPQARIVKLLDKASIPINPAQLAAQVYAINMDHQLLLRTLCDYAVTRFRPGYRRIYLISSILSEWPFSEKLSVQDGVVRYFEGNNSRGDEMQRLILLFADLLERRVISYSWLLRRCIARGWTHNEDAKGYLQLLVELPINNAPQSAQNTRDMILQRAQIAFDTEIRLVEEMIDALAGSGLSWLSAKEHMDVEPGINDFDVDELEWLASLTRNAKSVLATTISTRFSEAKVWEGQEYPRQLQIVIRILSVIQEFRRLNDVLVLAISNNARQDTLITLITTVGTFHPSLEGMGVLPTILEALATNWRRTFNEMKPSTYAIHVLKHLHTHLASSNPLLAQLLDEFTQTSQFIPIAYPAGASASPLSDHGLENLAIRDTSSVDEVLRLLTPDGHFDAPLFQRVLTATAKEGNFDITGITTFLELLRASDVAQVEELAKEWALEGIKVSGVGEDGRGVWWVIANLVCVELITIEDVISQVVHVLTTPGTGKELSESQSFELLVEICGLMCADSATKLNLSLANFLSLQSIRHRISSNESCLKNLAILFRVLLTLVGHAPDDIRGYVSTVTQSPFMLRMAIYHPDILLHQVIEPIVSMGDTPALNLTISAFRGLLGATDEIDTDFGQNIEQIFKSTSEFSMNLCRINLRLILEYSRLSNVAVGERSGELVERIVASVVGQGQLGKSGDLVKSLNIESKQLLRDHLEKSFLEAAPAPNGSLPDGQHPEIWSCEKISSAFKLLESTTCNDLTESAGSMDSRTVAKALLDKVKCIGTLLDQDEQPAAETDFNELVFGTTAPPVPSHHELIYCFILCLRILVLRWASLGVSDSIDLEAWITVLVGFLEHPRVTKEKLLVSYIYDIILCFYDELQPSPAIVNRLVAHFESSRSPQLETFLPFKRQNAFFDNLVMIKPSHAVPTEIPAKVWDNIESATLSVSENDGPFSLGLFDARERSREHSLWEPEAIRVGIS